MSLIALIAVYEDSPSGGGPRALIPLAGTTLLEHQARRARVAGADRVMLLIGQRPPAFDAALARLRADGIAVSLIEGIVAAAERVPPEDRLLLIADGCLADQGLLDRMARAPVPSIATIADAPDRAPYERIDAAQRWAGLALIDGARLIATAGMIGEWDPVSTLLRRTVQEGAARIDGGDVPPLLGNDAAALAGAERRLIGGTRPIAQGWAARWIDAPLAELLLPVLMRRRIDPLPLAGGGAGLAVAAGIAAAIGWLGPALILLLLSGIMATTAARLALVQARIVRHATALHIARLAGAALAVGGLARLLSAQSGQWGWWLMAGLLIGALAALHGERRIATAVSAAPEPVWLASAEGLPWALVPFALAGWWGAGLAAAVGYGLLSLIVRWRAIVAAAGSRRDRCASEEAPQPLP